MNHTDPPCAACAADVRRSRTLRGRVGSWLIKLGARLGGLHENDFRVAHPRWTPTPTEPGEYDGGGRWPRGDG